MFNFFVLFVLAFMLLEDFSQSLRLVEVRVPSYVIKGSTAQLECVYDLDGEALYSVKWYKDGNEFYRYVPRDIPAATTFLLPGVSVDVHNSSDAIVTLREVNLQSGGRFRCEVSGEAPSFQTVTEHADMVVVSLPDQGPPKINGCRVRYQIGDWVQINCTAGRSKPAVQLSWFVNNEAAEPYMLKKYETIISGREALETSVLGLQFRVEQRHFHNGDMKLKCVASLSTFYWRSNEESVEIDRPQKAPVLESRETGYASNSRADPVQGMSLRESFVTKILSFFIEPNAANRTDSTTSIKPTTIILLIAMTFITTNCIEKLCMKNGIRIVSKKSRKLNGIIKKNISEVEVTERRQNESLRQNKQDKLKIMTNQKVSVPFNKEMSSTSVTLKATNFKVRLTAQNKTICAAQESNITLENYISCTPTKKIHSFSAILSRLFSLLSGYLSWLTTQQDVVSLRSR